MGTSTSDLRLPAPELRDHPLTYRYNTQAACTSSSTGLWPSSLTTSPLLATEDIILRSNARRGAFSTPGEVQLQARELRCLDSSLQRGPRRHMTALCCSACKNAVHDAVSCTG